MNQTEDDVKRRILRAAVELLREKQDADKVSIRSIALRAGVSVGMANYHFQTKDNLIERAVQEYVSGVIREGGSEPVHDAETRLHCASWRRSRLRRSSIHFFGPRQTATE